MFINALDPVFMSIGPFSIRYYGIIYASCFIITFFMLRYFSKKKLIQLTKDEISEYLLYLMIGIVLGARLFYVLVYNNHYYFNHPLEIVMLWNGGLSFHGGLIGALIAGYIYSKKVKLPLLHLADITIIPLALCLALGRVGNFINGELPGRITHVHWCVIFKDYEGCRHPSQLYSSLKNFIIFGILWFATFFIYRKQLLQNHKEHQVNYAKPGRLFSLFLMLYGGFRFVIEFFREADIQVGYYFGLTMGQLLSIIVILSGIVLYYYIQKNTSKYMHNHNNHTENK